MEDIKVLKPDYYKGRSGRDVLEVAEDFNLCPFSANILKYIVRAGKKDSSKELEDLLKAKEYLERKIDIIKSRNNEK